MVALASCGEQVPGGEVSRPSIDYVEEAQSALVAVDGLPGDVLDALARTDIPAADFLWKQHHITIVGHGGGKHVPAVEVFGNRHAAAHKKTLRKHLDDLN